MQMRQAKSDNTDARTAVREIADSLGGPLDAVLFFASSRYDLDALGEALRQTFDCTVIGCTSAGQIDCAGFSKGGISALGFSGGHFSLKPHLIHPLGSCVERALAIAESLQDESPGVGRFGLLLIDGLSKSEERVASALYQALGKLPFIGASASDDLQFVRTCVYYEGAFISDAAVFTVVTTDLPFSVFKLQHFVPGSRRMVITHSDTAQRIIHEIDGLPAAEGYAEAIGHDVGELSAALISHPLLLRIGDDHFIRSISTVLDDLSLLCFSAIDTGLVVTAGNALDPITALDNAFAEVRRKIGEPQVIIGSDCVLRRLEFEQTGMLGDVGALLAKNKVFGFSTYGEQFNAFHVNQTFTGIAIGQ